MKALLTATLAALLLCCSCRHETRPADILDAPQMVAFLADAYLLEGFYAVETQYRYDAMTPDVLRAYDEILASHHITREQVEHSFDYYSSHPELYSPIQDSVLAILERQSHADTATVAVPNTAAPIILSM